MGRRGEGEGHHYFPFIVVVFISLRGKGGVGRWYLSPKYANVCNNAFSSFVWCFSIISRISKIHEMLGFNSNIISNILKIQLLCVSIHISYCFQINCTPVRLYNGSDKFFGQFQADYCNYVRNCAPVMKYSHPRNEIHIYH